MPAPGDAALVEHGAPPPPGIPHALFSPATDHPVGCTCCAARTGAALALDRLFLRRVHGEVPHFNRIAAVLATAAGETSLRAALAEDPVISARYRLG